MNKKNVAGFLLLAGMVLISVGAWKVYPPFGLIVTGFWSMIIAAALIVETK